MPSDDLNLQSEGIKFGTTVVLASGQKVLKVNVLGHSATCSCLIGATYFRPSS